MNVYIQRQWSRLVLVLLGVGALAAGVFFGAGTAHSSGDRAQASAVKRIVALVPKDIRSDGSVTIVTDATYPPMESINPDTGKIEGADIDLAKAIFAPMGLKVKFINAPFDSIIPGLQSKKYLVSFSSFTGTKEREKVATGVSYLIAGTSFYVPKGGKKVGSLSGLCGRTVAVEKGTTQADDVQTQSKKCTKAGKPAVKLSVFTDQNGANLALTSGRAQVGMADSPVAAEIVKLSKGKLVLSGKPYNAAPYDAFTSNKQLAKAMRAGIRYIMLPGKNGTRSKYMRILRKYGIQSGALKRNQVKINGAKE